MGIQVWKSVCAFVFVLALVGCKPVYDVYNPVDPSHDFDGDGQTEQEGDCDDSDATIYLNAPEICDGLDNDCSGAPGEDEVDADLDGFMVCENDCNDGDGGVNPDGVETACDYIDNDCDGVLHGDEVDDDLDG